MKSNQDSSRPRIVTATRVGVIVGLLSALLAYFTYVDRRRDRDARVEQTFWEAWDALGGQQDTPIIQAPPLCRPPDPTHLEKARRLLAKAELLAPGHARTLLLKGTLLSFTGDDKKAVPPLRDAYRLRPTEWLTATQLARSLLAIGSYDEALKVSRAAEAAAPTHFLAHYFVAESLTGQHDDVDAEREVTLALKLEPSCWFCLLHRAGIFYRRKNLGKALDDANAAISLNPQAPDAFWHRGFILSALGDAEGATEANPATPHIGNPSLLTPAARTYYADAIAAFDEALRLDCGFAIALPDRAHVHIQLGDYHAAVNDCTLALKWNSHLMSAHHNRAVAYCLLGEFSSAIPDFAAAVDLVRDGQQPRDSKLEAVVLTQRGMAYARMQEYRLAENDFRAALGADPHASAALSGWLELKREGHVE